MTIKILSLLLTIVLTSSRALASNPSIPDLEEVGKTLYAKDRAAWLATDRLLENGQLPSAIRGWVSLPSGGGWRVLFVEEESDEFCSRLSVVVDEEGASSLAQSENCDPLTSKERAMFLARQTAVSALRSPCSETYNTVVLPYEGEEAGWAVYLLAATPQPGMVVIGGHVRVLVREKGLGIVSYQPLSRTCLTSEMPSPDEAELVAMLVSQTVDDHPIETHVFLSLLHGLDFYVLTESAMWSVAEGRIKLLMDGEDYAAYLRRAKAAEQKVLDAEEFKPL